MRFYGIAVVHKTDKLFLPMFSILKDCFLMPHLYQGSNDSLCFSIRSGSFHLCKSLFNLVLGTELHEGVILRVSLVLQTIV